ncbi:MAG: hypothetical protein LQ342_002299 [Letrouitia transgressa]|nr:MAG: hypothetical protein LQ342_002299 [Letrouitia transgressa]
MLPNLLRTALCFLAIAFFSTLIRARPHELSKQERIASILAQKPLPTSALLAGAAMETPQPYPFDDVTNDSADGKKAPTTALVLGGTKATTDEGKDPLKIQLELRL